MQINCSWDNFPNFKSSEFDCKGLGGDFIDYNLVFILQTVRNKYGVVTVSSGWRSQEYNDSLTGSVKNSAHCKGKAADFYVGKCKTLEGRQEVMEFLKLFPMFKYCYCNENGNHPNMGDFIHVEVK